jgi:multicomponent Na+:H+ antiporter subunit D
VFVSLLTTMSMIRLWQYIFWGKPNRTYARRPHFQQPGVQAMLLAPAAVLVALSLAIGIFAQPALQMAQIAASQVIDRAAYINAVAPQEAASALGVQP